MTEHEANRERRAIESLIYQLVGNYISRRVESRTGLRWDEVKDSAARVKDYDEARAKVAKDAFLAVRARTGGDFINYFASTLCSVAQHIGDEAYVTLAQQLHSDSDRIRTLTLLALSARG
jgi:CRISPR-associated protein Cmx8